VFHLICVILAPSSITATEAKIFYVIFAYMSLIRITLSPWFLFILNINE